MPLKVRKKINEQRKADRKKKGVGWPNVKNISDIGASATPTLSHTPVEE